MARYAPRARREGNTVGSSALNFAIESFNGWGRSVGGQNPRESKEEYARGKKEEIAARGEFSGGQKEGEFSGGQKEEIVGGYRARGPVRGQKEEASSYVVRGVDFRKLKVEVKGDNNRVKRVWSPDITRIAKRNAAKGSPEGVGSVTRESPGAGSANEGGSEHEKQAGQENHSIGVVEFKGSAVGGEEERTKKEEGEEEEEEEEEGDPDDEEVEDAGDSLVKLLYSELAEGLDEAEGMVVKAQESTAATAATAATATFPPEMMLVMENVRIQPEEVPLGPEDYGENSILIAPPDKKTLMKAGEFRG